MKNFLIAISIMFILNSYSQSGEFTTYDLKKVMNLTSFKGAKKLKSYSPQKLNEFFNIVEGDSGLLKQININSWVVCEYKKIDNFSTYNYYYKKISRETFDLYCKELNALMLLDNVIVQQK
jgi:hypothetical protein